MPTPEFDQSALNRIVEWVWAIPSALAIWLWRKVESAASKHETKELREKLALMCTKAELENLINGLNESNKQWRDTTKVLFANAESDRKQTNERFGKAMDTLHGVHSDLLKEIGELKGSVERVRNHGA